MPEKINKMPKFYMIFAQKIFFPEFFLWGATAPLPSPVSYAYANNQKTKHTKPIQ